LETAGLPPLAAARVAAACHGFSNLPPAVLAARIGFLVTELGLERGDLERLLAKWPRAVDADSRAALAPRLAYLRRIGLADAASLKRVALRAPAVLGSASLRGAVMPRVAALRTRVGLAPADVARVVARSPTILLASEDAVEERVRYLTDGSAAGAGLTRAQLARAVAAHPTLLEYHPHSMHARVAFLRDVVGLVPPALGDVIARAPSLLSLDVGANLAPKWAFAADRLAATADTVARCPVLLTLSLERRLAPRVAFLEARRRTQKGGGGGGSDGGGGGDERGAAAPGRRARGATPPVSYLTWSDAMFAERGARVPLDEWTEWRDAWLRREERSKAKG
jgi:hypothetical protein